MKESSSSAEIILYGGGGHGKVVLDCLQEQGVKVKSIIDNKYTGELLGVKRLSELPESVDPNCAVIIAIGDNKARKDLSQNIRLPFANAIHSSARISLHASIGTGVMILHNVIVQIGATIGNHVILNTGAQVDHDCVIGDYVHIAPGSVLCGSITVGEGTLIGAGAVIKPGVRIGAWAMIGAGAVVVKDLPDYAVAVGNPARVIKHIQP
jgi:sugar O-acyltransferase (sialic acid O-acetyltransferase NeuD family)